VGNNEGDALGWFVAPFQGTHKNAQHQDGRFGLV
jgi:hypothetical protein